MDSEWVQWITPLPLPVVDEAWAILDPRFDIYGVFSLRIRLAHNIHNSVEWVASLEGPNPLCKTGNSNGIPCRQQQMEY